MATFKSNIDITDGGTYQSITNGKPYFQVMTDLNGEMNKIQEYLEDLLPEPCDSSDLPTLLLHGKLIVYNDQLYFGNTLNAPVQVGGQGNISVFNATKYTCAEGIRNVASHHVFPIISINGRKINLRTDYAYYDQLSISIVAGDKIWITQDDTTYGRSVKTDILTVESFNKSTGVITVKEYPTVEAPMVWGAILNKDDEFFTSRSEGSNTLAFGAESHAEGCFTVALSSYAHAEGHSTVAAGSNSHTEGSSTIASASDAHAEGFITKASGDSSHAEGSMTNATGRYSHAEGYYTTASSFASHASGKFNKAMQNTSSSSSTTGDAFVIGNGTRESSLSNALRVTYAGEVKGISSFQSSGADYAEYFEWLDGNPDNEDRVGYFVTLDNNKIRIANSTDYILGVVSGQPCIIGNADEDWLGRWQHDEYGRFIKEYLIEEKEEISTEDMTKEEIMNLRRETEIREENNKFYRITSQVVDYETPSWRYKVNPDYDYTQEYIERKDRPEWSAIGMMGVLSVRDDGTCKVNGFCKVAEGGIATTVGDCALGTYGTYRVIQRVSDNVIKIVFHV